MSQGIKCSSVPSWHSEIRIDRDEARRWRPEHYYISFGQAYHNMRSTIPDYSLNIAGAINLVTAIGTQGLKFWEEQDAIQTHELDVSVTETFIVGRAPRTLPHRRTFSISALRSTSFRKNLRPGYFVKGAEWVVICGALPSVPNGCWLALSGW